MRWNDSNTEGLWIVYVQQTEPEAYLRLLPVSLWITFLFFLGDFSRLLLSQVVLVEIKTAGNQAYLQKQTV